MPGQDPDQQPIDVPQSPNMEEAVEAEVETEDESKTDPLPPIQEEIPEPTPTFDDTYTKKQLYAIAKANEIEGRSKLDKEGLIEVLNENEVTV